MLPVGVQGTSVGVRASRTARGPQSAGVSVNPPVRSHCVVGVIASARCRGVVRVTSTCPDRGGTEAASRTVGRVSSHPSRSADPATDTEREHDGPVAGLQRWRERIRQRPSVDGAYRLAVAVAGFAIIGVGVVLLPLPGPGWLIIFLGLGLLATEYEWSRRLLAYSREQVARWTHWVAEQSIVVRALVGLGCLVLVAAVIGAVLWFFGVPSWVPLVDDLPTRA